MTMTASNSPADALWKNLVSKTIWLPNPKTMTNSQKMAMPRDSKTETIVLPEAIDQNAPPTAVVIVAAAAAAAVVVVATASVDAAVAAAVVVVAAVAVAAVVVAAVADAVLAVVVAVAAVAVATVAIDDNPHVVSAPIF
jgi:hypothetical protein